MSGEPRVRVMRQLRGGQLRLLGGDLPRLRRARIETTQETGCRKDLTSLGSRPRRDNRGRFARTDTGRHKTRAHILRHNARNDSRGATMANLTQQVRQAAHKQLANSGNGGGRIRHEVSSGSGANRYKNRSSSRKGTGQS